MIKYISTFILLLSIVYAAINTYLEWRKFTKEAKNENINQKEPKKRVKALILKSKKTRLYVGLIIIQLLILIFSLFEKNDLNANITSLQNKVDRLSIYLDLDEANPEVKKAIEALFDNDEEKAKSIIQTLKNTTEDLNVKLYNTGLKHKNNRNYKKARDYFKLCSLLSEDDPNVLFNLAITEQYLYKGKENNKIIELFEKSIKLDPNLIDAHISLGNIYESNNDYQNAENNYKKALKIDKTNEEARKCLAYLYFSKNKFQQAISQFENLTKLNPTEPEYYFKLAICYFKIEQFDKAKFYIEIALSKDHDNPTYVEFYSDLLNNPKVQPFMSDISLDANEIEIVDYNSSMDEDTLLIEKENDEPKETNKDTLKKVDPNEYLAKKYSRIRLTIINVNYNRHAADELGFLLRKEFGVRFAAISSSGRYRNTRIYYNNSKDRNVAKEIAHRLPGVQRFGPLPNSVKLTKYKDIVIFLGNDCANVARYR